jgi:RNA polymerase sigma factor (sigma-70 family)
MDAKLASDWGMAETDRSIVEAFRRESGRLGGFIRRRVPDPADAEDLLQEVFSELVEATRLPEPIEQVGAWLFRVARNRITDLFRRRSRNGVAPAARDVEADDDEASFEDLLPAADGGPEAAYARQLLLDELEAALAELPEEQRSTFVAHELDGLSFKEIAAQTGVGVNTLLSRKRYAVLYLRGRLQAIHDEFAQP